MHCSISVCMFVNRHEHGHGSSLGPSPGDLRFRTRPLVGSGEQHKLSASIKSVRPLKSYSLVLGMLRRGSDCVCDSGPSGPPARLQPARAAGFSDKPYLCKIDPPTVADWDLSRPETHSPGGCKSALLRSPVFLWGEFNQVQVPRTQSNPKAGVGRAPGALQPPLVPQKEGRMPGWPGSPRSPTLPATSLAGASTCPAGPRTTSPARRPGQRLQSSWPQSSYTPCCLFRSCPGISPLPPRCACSVQIPSPILCLTLPPLLLPKVSCMKPVRLGLDQRALQILLRLPLFFFLKKITNHFRLTRKWQK